MQTVRKSQLVTGTVMNIITLFQARGKVRDETSERSIREITFPLALAKRPFKTGRNRSIPLDRTASHNCQMADLVEVNDSEQRLGLQIVTTGSDFFLKKALSGDPPRNTLPTHWPGPSSLHQPKLGTSRANRKYPRIGCLAVLYIQMM